MDLVRKVVALEQETCEPDPENWYSTKFGKSPDYSVLLEQLAKTAAERTTALAGYFEPSLADRESGRKLPTKAHQQIAKLVAKGYLRVIITTNFDRLMEQALEAEGIVPTVISTVDAIKGAMPKGLYARSLLIIILPMVILQSVVAWVFMERHWNTVTRRLSGAVTQDISALIDIYKTYPHDSDNTQIRRLAQERLGLVVDFLPVTEMPPPGPKPFFSLLDQALSEEIRKQIGKPFWIDTVGRSALVEIRIQLDDTVMRIFARRSAAYASNSGIFLLWMVGTSLVLLTVAVLFLRNQIRPILRLADAAESFGKGREVPGFRPR